VGRSSKQDDLPDGKLTLQQLDLLLRRLESLPSPRHVAARLLQLTAAAGGSDQRRSPERVVELFGCDPALTARLLRLAGAAGRRPAGTVAEAAKRLGHDAVRSAGLSASAPEAADSAGPPEGLDMSAFWRHCLAVAVASEMLVEKLPAGPEPAEAFTCGLLHDLGKLAAWRILPKSYQRVLAAVKARQGNIADHERRVIGMDHAVIGRRLAEHWRLAQAIQQVTWMHNQPPEAIPESLQARKLILTVSLADAVARQQRIGFSGNYSFPRSCQQLAADVGLAQADLARVEADLAGRVERLLGDLDLDETSRETPLARTLAEANAELDRMNRSLCARIEQLAGQARALDHFRDFAAGLSEDSTVADALLGAAKVIAAACKLDCPTGCREAIVAYSLGIEAKEVLAVRHDGREDPQWRTFSAARDLRERIESGSPAVAADQLQALLGGGTGLAGWIELTSCRHRPLLCAGRWVGGILYPAAEGEASPSEQAVSALAGALGMALAIVQGRCRAVALSDQLAGASQVLAETQDALAEAKTRAAVAEMAAGAAHEMNTPLAVISGRAQLMGETASDDEQRKTWRLVAEQAERISQTISDLMDFACPEQPQPEAIDVPELLKDAADMFARSDCPKAAARRVDIETGRQLAPVWADRNQLRAAIAELIANASMATESSAPVRLAAEMDEAGESVLVTVADSGRGMDQQTLAQAFTPFFSQQEAGRRRGLGLARVKRQLANNGGSIWIDSRPGEGTTVYLRLRAAGPRQGQQKDSR